MIRKFALPIGALAIGSAVFMALTWPARVDPASLGPHIPDLENGREMFYAGGCAACHARRDLDAPLQLAGGGPVSTPFGTFYPPNISPDPTDGLGNWTEAQFVTAMTKGTSPGGRHYFPAFPYTSYQSMTFADLRDLFAYLKTLPSVKGKVRDHDLRFPFNIRALVGIWKKLFLESQMFVPDPIKPPAWNRGAYLVNGPGHCAECHTPRNVMGGLESGRRFSGVRAQAGEGGAPDITQGGLSNWSEQDFARLLKTGLSPNGEPVDPPMMAVVHNTAQLTDIDRAAMAAYIKSLPPADVR